MSTIKSYETVRRRYQAASALAPMRALGPRIVFLPEGRGSRCHLGFVHANSWARRHLQILKVAFGLSAAE